MNNEKPKQQRRNNSSALERVMPGHSLPRERAVESGIKALTDIELIAILLGSGIKGKNVIELATEILRKVDGHLSYLTTTPIETLSERHTGLGSARSITLLAAIELGLRAAADARRVQIDRVRLTDAEHSAELMRHHFTGLDHEEFWVMMLNNSLGFIREFRVSSGGTRSTVVDPKLIIRPMLNANASRAILFHNHPSGTLQPSTDDINLTLRVREAARLFDMDIIDHIIITDRGFYSMYENGKL